MSSPTTQAVELLPAFARHETFHPRYGWLKKGFDEAANNPGVFARDDATTVLGVGKNMVRAIRYWCLAYKVLAEVPSKNNPRVSDLVPTDFGKRLLSERGWDPYLEDPGSLWLLHWHLLRAPCKAPSWWAIFNRARPQEFTDDELVEDLKRFRDETEAFEGIVDGSLVKDVRCVLRMYGSVTQGRDLVEDSVDSPFAELELFRAIPGPGRAWAVNIGPKRQLPDDVVVYACLDYARRAEGSRLLSISGLASGPGSPGRAFALTETSLGDAIARYGEHHTSLVRLVHSVGNRQLEVPSELDAPIAEGILDGYYRGDRIR